VRLREPRAAGAIQRGAPRGTAGGGIGAAKHLVGTGWAMQLRVTLLGMGYGPPKMRRLTEAEFQQHEREEWPIFEAKLRACPTIHEAWQVSQTGVGPDLPGRRFYSSLATFLISFGGVDGASAAERKLYLELVERSVAAGAVTQEGLEAARRSCRLA
jgi:hypothetical protein